MCGNEHKVHSIQIYTTYGVGYATVPVQAYGRFHCRLSAVWYKHHEAAKHTVLMLRSRQMNLKYPSGTMTMSGGVIVPALVSIPYPTIITSVDHQIGGLNGMIQWDADINGQFELELVRLSGDAPHADDEIVMNIELTPIGEGGSQ
jgi:hypothetical protein